MCSSGSGQWQANEKVSKEGFLWRFAVNAGSRFPMDKLSATSAPLNKTAAIPPRRREGKKRTGSMPWTFKTIRQWRCSAYIGIFVLIPVFAAKNSPYARYHANQGLLLFLAEIVWTVFCSVVNACLGLLSLFGPLFWVISAVISSILGILSLVFLALAIYGIVNAATGKAKPLPVLGRFTLLH